MSELIVVKVGTKVLTKPDGSLDQGYLMHLVAQIVALKKRDIQVLLVTSGAVAAGKKLISPTGKSEETYKQACAAVGQAKLIGVYIDLFEKLGHHCAQVLVTKEDFRDSEHDRHMRNCISALLQDGIIPIVNENDVVATAELMFTDNDELAGLIAKQVGAKKLIILTSTDGILDSEGNTVSTITPHNLAEVWRYVTESVSTGGRGGMISKLHIAVDLANLCIDPHIVDGRRKEVLLDVMNNIPTGTVMYLK